ncbi:hypothetical protein Leryth_026465 [Lithospermum erythrorhizon]|nr:hypothetical protein Leryth_026465 [Lithospermum erythrorhizon]
MLLYKYNPLVSSPRGRTFVAHKDYWYDGYHFQQPGLDIILSHKVTEEEYECPTICSVVGPYDVSASDFKHHATAAVDAITRRRLPIT